MEIIKHKKAGVLAVLGALMLGVFGAFDMASAAAQYDLAPVTTGIVDQVQDALTTILPIAGGILALFVGWKIIKRMAKA